MTPSIARLWRIGARYRCRSSMTSHARDLRDSLRASGAQEIRQVITPPPRCVAHIAMPEEQAKPPAAARVKHDVEQVVHRIVGIETCEVLVALPQRRLSTEIAFELPVCLT